MGGRGRVGGSGVVRGGSRFLSSANGPYHSTFSSFFIDSLAFAMREKVNTHSRIVGLSFFTAS